MRSLKTKLVSKSLQYIVCIQLFSYVCFSTTAHALLHLSAGNEWYTKAPTFNEVPFDSVARICNKHGKSTSGSAVYIKGCYLLTAAHVKMRSHVTFDNEHFYEVDKSFKPIQIAKADLKLFRLAHAPNLAPTPLFDKPHGDTGITGFIVGWGLGHANNSQAHASNVSQTKQITHNWGSKDTMQKRWGTNHVNSYSSWKADGRPRLTTSLCSQASASEVALTTYDSGGALFVYNNMQWKLAGIATHASQSGSSTFGTSSHNSNKNYFERIYYYNEQIESIIEQSMQEEIANNTASPATQNLIGMSAIAAIGYVLVVLNRKSQPTAQEFGV